MEKIKNYLVRWTLNFIKHRDNFLRQIESIDENQEEFDIFVKYKTKEHGYLVIPQISDPDDIIIKLHPDKHVSLIILNNEENLKKIMNNWKRFTGFRFFSIYFVNPLSNTDTKWIIFPYTHERIKDDASFEVGMRTMFDTVEPISLDTLENLIKREQF